MENGTLLIEHARYVLTVDQQRRIIRDGSVLVERGKITRVGKAAELAGTRADRVIDGRRFVVTPGFVNGHMHISYAHAVRGIFPDDVGSPLNHVFKLQAAMTEEEEYWTTLIGLLELVTNGTVCFVDPGSTKYMDACLQAYQDAGIRVCIGDGVTDVEGPLPLARYSTADAIARTRAFMGKWHGKLDGRITTWAMPFSSETASAELLRAMKQLADEHGSKLTVHFSSGAKVRADYEKAHGVGPTQYLDKLGVLGPRMCLAHALGIDDAEIDLIAKSGATVAMCPVTAAKGARGAGALGRMPELRSKGVPVALGCDSPNNSNHLDILRAANMASIHYKDARQDMKVLPAETVLEMATLIGADALGVGDQIGSVEAGKKADLLLWDTHRPEWQALFNPLNNLIYNTDGRSLHTVIIDGRVVVEDRKQSFVDESMLYGKVQEIGEKLLARTGISYPRSRWPVV